MKPDEFIQWRKSLGITQKEAAQKLGYKYRSTISQFENGHTEITERVALLCNAIKSNSNNRRQK